jgi:hypothetical protein
MESSKYTDDTLKFISRETIIATHDSKEIESTVRLWKNSKNGKNFEFEFLKGIRDELKRDLVEKGCRVHTLW